MRHTVNDVQDGDKSRCLAITASWIDSEALKSPAIHSPVNITDDQSFMSNDCKDLWNIVLVVYKFIDLPIQRVKLSVQVTQNIDVPAGSFHSSLGKCSLCLISHY